MGSMGKCRRIVEIKVAKLCWRQDRTYKILKFELFSYQPEGTMKDFGVGQ